MRPRSAIAALLALATLGVLVAIFGVDRNGGEATAAAAIADYGRASDRDRQAAVPGELIVRFEPDADADKREQARGSVNARVKRQLPVKGMQLLDLPAGTRAADAAKRVERQPGVAYAEPNFSRHVLGSVNDRYFSYEWGLHNTGQTINGRVGTPDADIDAPEAWDVNTGDPGTTVAVVDTGADATNPDLQSQVVAGWDFVDGDSDPADLNGHGTHVSGTIAAAGNDSMGIAGVAYHSKVMPVRVLGADGSGTVADVVSGYQYAAAHGARIVNASLGSDSFSRAERDAIAAAPNTLFVVAAGNGGDDGIGDDVDVTPEYPCAYPLDNIVCVAATDSTDHLAGFSNFGGMGVDIAAPGVDIASTWLAASWAWLDGTSMATPHVAGTAALVASRFPQATAGDLRVALLDGADHPAAIATKVGGGRRLNAYGAVTAPLPAPATPTTTSTAPAPAAAPAPAPEPEAPAPAPTDTGPPPQPAPPPIADTSAPIVRVRAPSRARSSTLRRRGLPVTISCSEACRIGATLVIRRRAHTSSLARRTRSLSAAGRTRVSVRPSRTIQRRWSRLVHRGTRLRLELSVRDRAANARRVVKTVVVAR
jgi:thermitase